MIEPERMDAFSIKTSVPEGSLFVIIAEDEKGEVLRIEVHIGKSGSTLSAWCDSISKLITLALRSGVSLTTIIEEMSGITSDRLSRQGNMKSAPQGIAYCLLRYFREKATQIKRNVDELDHGSIDPG